MDVPYEAVGLLSSSWFKNQSSWENFQTQQAYEDVLSSSWFKNQSLVQVTRKKTTKLSIKAGMSDTVSVSRRVEKTQTEHADTAAAAAVWSHEVDDDSCWDGRQTYVTTAD